MEGIVLTLASEAPTLALLLLVIYMNNQRTNSILETYKENSSELRGLLDKALDNNSKVLTDNQRIMVKLDKTIDELRDRQTRIAGNIRKVVEDNERLSK
jgi:hypothetical protein